MIGRRLSFLSILKYNLQIFDCYKKRFANFQFINCNKKRLVKFTVFSTALKKEKFANLWFLKSLKKFANFQSLINLLQIDLFPDFN